jgi:hypothetical protein
MVDSTSTSASKETGMLIQTDGSVQNLFFLILSVVEVYDIIPPKKGRNTALLWSLPVDERDAVRKANRKKKTKRRGLSPRANYTDRAAAAGRRS